MSTRRHYEALIMALLFNVTLFAQSGNTIWSEDFASGIPTTWTNAGVNGVGVSMPNAVWEYRGSSTTPNLSVGSRGAYSGTQLPIISPTDTNGFVIFDSDYLDTYGLSNNSGNGPAAAPHKSALITPVINLTAYSNAELKFSSCHRYFEGRALVLFSTNGGTTWSDTVLAHPGIAVNSGSARDEVVSINVSSIIGGQSNVKIQFLFDGTYDDPGASGSGRGYYYWMIDDIVLTEMPKYDIRFTQWDDAPETDIIYGPANGSSKMGFMVNNFLSDQTRDITFDANAYNFGLDTIHNLKLKVDILSASNTLLSSFQSATLAALAPTDTANYNLLNTYATAWNPNAKGEYRIVYNLMSDSAWAVHPDTLKIVVDGNIMSNDNGVNSNQIGTNNLGNNGSALASRIDFVQAATVESLWVGLGSQTRVGGIVTIRVFDTVGFDLINGYSFNSLKAALLPYTITAADTAAGYFEVPFPSPLQVPANSGYYFAVYMNSNNGINRISIRNDQSVSQPAMSKLMYDTSNARWFTGYTATRTLNSLWIRPVLKDSIGISASGPLSFCEGQSVALTIQPGLDSYLWNTGDTTNTILVDSTGSYFAVVSLDGVFDTLQPLAITVYPNPDASITIIQGDTAICQGDTTVLQATYDPNYSYQWLLNGNPIAGATNQTFSVLGTGDYAVEVTTNTSCFKTSTDTSISVYPLPTAQVNVLGATTFCAGDSVLFSANIGSGLSYQWFLNGSSISGATQATFVAKLGGSYTVEVSNANTCSAVSIANVVSVLPVVNTSVITGPVMVNPAIQYNYSVTPTTGNTYNWTATNGFVIAGQGSNSVDVIWAAGTIGTLDITESNGSCSDTASLTIQIGIGIDENGLKNHQVSIFPNPVSNALSLRFNDLQNDAKITLQLIDVFGKLIFEKKAEIIENEYMLNTESLANGVYMLVIPEIEASVKVVIQH